MNLWITLVLALAAVGLMAPLWMWWSMVRNVSNLRLQRSEAHLVDRTAVPAPHRGILDAAAAEATAMGFVYAYSMQCRPAAQVPGVPWVYSDVFVSADGRTQLQVAPSTLPEAGRTCTFQWVTVWRGSGPHDLTTHRYRHFLMWWPARWRVHDDYLPSVQAAWAAHQHRIDAEQAAGRSAETDVEAARTVCLSLLQEFVPEGVARGYLSPVPSAGGDREHLWRVRWGASLRLAWGLLRGMRRASQAEAGPHPVAHVLPEGAAPSPELSPQGRLEADLQAFEQHQAYQAAMAARPRRKWLALGLTAGLFVLVGGVLMSWRTAIVLLAVIGLHEGGHWLAMRTLGYRHLSVLFIPGLGGVALGHKPSASTWNKLAVYLAGPVPGLVLAMVAMVAVAKGWMVPTGWVQDFFLMCLVINYLNLLPVHPLDGGRVVESLLFVRWPVLRFAFVVTGMCALGAWGWMLQDNITLALAGLLALGVPRHWRLMQVDRQVPRVAAGRSVSESEAAARIFEVLQQPRFARWTFAQRLGAVRALLPELQGTRLGRGETVAALALYLACLLSPVAALWATGAGPLILAMRPGLQYAPDDVDEAHGPTYSAPTSEFVSPDEWARRLQDASALPEPERLQLYLQAGDSALELEDTQAALERYQQAWALAEPLPTERLARARALLGLLQATEDAQASQAWGLRLLAEIPADADAPLRAVQAQAESLLAHQAASPAEAIERMQRAQAVWAPPHEASDAGLRRLPPEFARHAAAARSALSRWHMQRDEPGDPQEALRWLQRNVDAWPVPDQGDRSRNALAARVGRADAQLELAWLQLSQGQWDRADPVVQQVLAQLPQPVSASWVHVQDRALETLVWLDVARYRALPPAARVASTGQSLQARLRRRWQDWQQSVRQTASPRRDVVWQLDRWAIAQALGEVRVADEARSELLLRAQPGAYWATRWCDAVGDATTAPRPPDMRDVRELSRREAAQATGLCQRRAEPAGPATH